MFKEKVNAWTDRRTDARTDARTDGRTDARRTTGHDISSLAYGQWSYKCSPKLRQKVKVKVDTVTSDDIKIYYTGKFQDFTAKHMIKCVIVQLYCWSKCKSLPET